MMTMYAYPLFNSPINIMHSALKLDKTHTICGLDSSHKHLYTKCIHVIVKRVLCIQRASELDKDLRFLMITSFTLHTLHNGNVSYILIFTKTEMAISRLLFKQ